MIPGRSGLSKAFRAVPTLLHQNPALASSLGEEPKPTQRPASPLHHVGLLTVCERLAVGSVVPSVWNDTGITRALPAFEFLLNSHLPQGSSLPKISTSPCHSHPTFPTGFCFLSSHTLLPLTHLTYSSQPFSCSMHPLLSSWDTVRAR